VKKYLLILVLAILLPLSVCGQSELYRRYASRADVTVAQVSGFQLNDSVRVDVVMLTADSKSAWTQLAMEFDIRSDEGVSSWLGSIDRPAKRTRWSGRPLLRVIASPKRRTIAFYRLENETQYDALLEYQTNNMKNKKQEK